MHSIPRILVALMLVTGVAACSKKVKETTPATVDGGSNTGIGTGSSTDGNAIPAPGSGLYGQGALDTDACLRQRALYFDLDQDSVKPEYQNVVLCHAKYLRERPSARLTLEGHTDERGSQEYNLGLGERRANAVRQALLAQGANGSQITVVSFGEERPECREFNESCWSQNRRADLNYTVP